MTANPLTRRSIQKKTFNTTNEKKPKPNNYPQEEIQRFNPQGGNNLMLISINSMCSILENAKILQEQITNIASNFIPKIQQPLRRIKKYNLTCLAKKTATPKQTRRLFLLFSLKQGNHTAEHFRFQSKPS